MPIHIKININRDVLSHIHITRMDENLSMDPDALILYSVVVKDEPPRGSHLAQYAAESPSWGEWEAGDRFYHRYGDGALVCVQKALEAYNKAAHENVH